MGDTPARKSSSVWTSPPPGDPTDAGDGAIIGAAPGPGAPGDEGGVPPSTLARTDSTTALTGAEAAPGNIGARSNWSLEGACAPSTRGNRRRSTWMAWGSDSGGRSFS